MDNLRLVLQKEVDERNDPLLHGCKVRCARCEALRNPTFSAFQWEDGPAGPALALAHAPQLPYNKQYCALDNLHRFHTSRLESSRKGRRTRSNGIGSKPRNGGNPIRGRGSEYGPRRGCHVPAPWEGRGVGVWLWLWLWLWQCFDRLIFDTFSLPSIPRTPCLRKTVSVVGIRST
jgi:hypothetical protein